MLEFRRLLWRSTRGFGQAALLWGLATLCNRLAAALHLPVPGSILGCVLLFALLQLGVVRLTWVEAGADWLIAQLLLFFLPPAAGIVQYPSLLARDGWRLLLVILASTTLVMAATGAFAETMARLQHRPKSYQALAGKRAV